MPVIALPTAKPIADLPATALNRERGPVVDYSGEIRQIGQNAQLSQGALMNPDALSAPFEALDSIGRAIAKAGDTLGAIRAERDEAQTRTQLYEADTAMQVAALDFDKRKVDMDPSQWGPEFNKTIQSARNAWSQNPNLTNTAREAGALKWERFSLTGTKGMEESATVKMFADAKNATGTEVQIATIQQDDMAFAAAKEAARKYHPNPAQEKLWDEEYKREGERQTKRFEAEQSRLLLIDERARASANPKSYLEESEERLKADELGSEERLRIESGRDTARSTLRQNYSDQAFAADEMIATGELETPTEVDELVAGGKLHPRLADQVKADLFKKQAFDAEIDRKNNAAQYYSEAWMEVEAYDPSKDDDGRTEGYRVLRMIREKVGPEDSGYLRQKHYGKMTGAVQKLDAPKQAYGLVDDILKTQFNPRNGPVPWEIAKKEKGKVVFTEDKAKHIEALTIQAGIQQEMYEWLKQNPEKAKDPENVRKKSLEVISNRGIIQSVQQVLQPQASARGGLDESLISTVKGFESFKPQAYIDYKQTSVGYGTRAKSMGERLTETQADSRLREELTKHAGEVDEAAKLVGLKLTPGQRNALISFDFNTGKGYELIQSSKGNLSEIRRRMLLYTKAGGEELPGLVKRRQKEASIFDS